MDAPAALVDRPSPNNSPLVKVEQPASGVCVLRLNRPRKSNALSQELIDRLLKDLRRASYDSSIGAIIITGYSGSSDNGDAKRFFSAGADIAEIAKMSGKQAQSIQYLKDLNDGVQSVRKPVIAAVDGYAHGGGFELALMCDMILASDRSSFRLPEVTLGVIPGAGGTQRLTSIVGKFRAMKMILTAESISAQAAMDMGLLYDVVGGDEDVVERAVELASDKLFQFSPNALASAKKAICRADEAGQDLEYERKLYYETFDHPDKDEGMDPEVWKGKRLGNWL